MRRPAGQMDDRRRWLSEEGAHTIDLFRQAHEANLRQAQPLAARMRPRTIDEFVGQDHFIGPGELLRRMLLASRPHSE